MKNFRVSFTWNGQHMWDYVVAPTLNEAWRIVTMRYPGATSPFITEER